ncbi:unnamed protein product, partial [Staurois parvus]
DRRCAVFLGHRGSLINGKNRRCWFSHVQSQLITWDMYTDHQGTDDQCALMICVAPAVPPVSAHQWHINATYQCPSELPFSVTHQSQSVPPISAAYQCPSVMLVNAHQCHLPVSISAAYQCPSLQPHFRTSV